MRIYHNPKGWDTGAGSAQSLPFTIISDTCTEARKIKQGFDYDIVDGAVIMRETKLNENAVCIIAHDANDPAFLTQKDRILFYLAQRAGIIT